MCLEEIESIDADYQITHYKPYTRDTFGYAIKATYGEDKNGNPVMIMKQPKALSWKKSQRGCCIVAPDGQSFTDGHTFEEAHINEKNNLLELVFCDGQMIRDMTLAEIRERMNPEGF
jgi:nicotinamide phosphoribosyltransferase